MEARHPSHFLERPDRFGLPTLLALEPVTGAFLVPVSSSSTRTPSAPIWQQSSSIADSRQSCQNIVPAHHLVRAGVSVPSVVGGDHLLRLIIILHKRHLKNRKNLHQYTTRLVSLSPSSPPSSSLAGGISGFKVTLTRSPSCCKPMVPASMACFNKASMVSGETSA